MSPQRELLIVWLTFAALGSVAVIVALVWAVRTGQFAHQDRARRLPLEAGIPEEKTTTTAKATTTATTSPSSAGGFNGKATATTTATASPSDACGSAPAAGKEP